MYETVIVRKNACTVSYDLQIKENMNKQVIYDIVCKMSETMKI